MQSFNGQPIFSAPEASAGPTEMGMHICNFDGYIKWYAGPVGERQLLLHHYASLLLTRVY